MKKFRFVSIALAGILLFAVSATFASEAPDVIKLKKDLEISEGMIVKDVIVIDGNLTVLGRVEGCVVVVGGVMTLRPGAYVGGDALVIGEIVKDVSSQVAGKITQIYVPRLFPSMIDFFRGGWLAFWAALGVLALIGFLGLAILIIAFIPKHMGAIVIRLESSFLIMFLWGILWFALIIPIALLLLISIIGIVLIPLELILVAFAIMIGYIASAVLIGKRIFEAANRPATPLLCAILGIVVLFLVGLIPIVGAMVKAVFIIAGYGAVVTSRIGNVKSGADIT